MQDAEIEYEGKTLIVDENERLNQHEIEEKKHTHTHTNKQNRNSQIY